MTRTKIVTDLTTGEQTEEPYTETEDMEADAVAAAVPTDSKADQDTLNAALVAPGSVVRALGLVLFSEINKLRVKNGDPAYTLAQFKTALLAQMR